MRSGTFYTALGVAALAVFGHILADLDRANREELEQRVATAVSNGTVNLALIGSDQIVIPLREPSLFQEVVLRQLIEDGKRNIGNAEFPAYATVAVYVMDAKGKAFCTLPIEQRKLGDLMSGYPTTGPAYRSAQSVDDISDLCGISRKEIAQQYAKGADRAHDPS